jgi:hypothetical protein
VKRSLRRLVTIATIAHDSSRQLQRAVIVAVAVMNVVQMSRHDVVGVISVRDALVPTACTVNVRRFVALAAVPRRTRRWVVSADRDHVLVDVVAVHMMEMTIVNVVLVAVVLDGRVAAVWSVLMIVNLVVAHGVLALLDLVRFLVVLVVAVWLCRMLDRAVDEIAHVSIGQGVEDVLASPPSRDDALRAEEAKLLGDGGEPDACRLGELRDTPFAVAETMEELQS